MISFDEDKDEFVTLATGGEFRYITSLDGEVISITSEGELVCVNEAKCPTEGKFHEVIGGNKFSAVFQRIDGALMYIVDGKWIVDTTSVYAGVIGKDIYKMTNTGDVYKNDQLIHQNAKLMYVNDEEVVIQGETDAVYEAKKLKAVNQESKIMYFNGLMVETLIETNKNELNECPLNTYLENETDKCIYSCTGYILEHST